MQGWSEFVVSKQLRGGATQVIGVDILPTAPMDGAIFIIGNLKESLVRDQIVAAALGQRISTVLSDMAPNTTGDAAVDHYRSLELANLAMGIAKLHLSAGGSFLCKIFRGSDDKQFESGIISEGFEKVQWIKPAASRSESKEVYVLARGFRSK